MHAVTTFTITIDTEADNVWANHRAVTTENARFLIRFQKLCESFDFKPTYLTTYEMAVDKKFQAFGRTLLERETGEIGTHIHAWNSPPFAKVQTSQVHPIYITELPSELISAKVEYMTSLLTDSFEVRPVSHRGGRWAFNEQLAKVLVDQGYLVDCSVTPGVSWRHHKGDLRGLGGPTYVDFSLRPYFVDLDDVRRSGGSPLLELPVTIRCAYNSLLQRIYHSVQARSHTAAIVLSKAVGDPYTWLRPNGHNIDSMLSLVDWALSENLSNLEFMMHSSELMPGGSPTFPTSKAIERLYEHLDRLFRYVTTKGIAGVTLASFRRSYSEP
jgi:hypothetical protein